MVDVLLDTRRANLSSFLDAKDKKAIIRGWSRVAFGFQYQNEYESSHRTD